jgi:hypothetical protein
MCLVHGPQFAIRVLPTSQIVPFALDFADNAVCRSRADVPGTCRSSTKQVVPLSFRELVFFSECSRDGSSGNVQHCIRDPDNVLSSARQFYVASVCKRSRCSAFTCMLLSKNGKLTK